MRARGQGILTIALVAIIAILTVSFDRLGSKAPAAASPGAAPSGVWLCPHGGGPDWEAAVTLANPGETEVQARVTSLSGARDRGAVPDLVTVPAGSQVQVPATASERGSSTYVEYFGGWIAAGWVARGASGESGIGAEPCTSAPGGSWFSSGLSTGEGEQTYLVVMNPFASGAVFDVALYFAPPRTPVRDSDLTDLTLDPGRSIAIRLSNVAPGEAAIGVELHASSGRVAAATTVISESRGITSVLASSATTRTAFLPTLPGAGQSILSLSVPTARGTDVGAVLLSDGRTRPVPNLAAAALEPASAAIFPVTTDRPTSVDVSVQEGEPLMAALRTQGPGNDDAATAGATEPAAAWVVPPTVAGEPAHPGLVIVNPDDEAVIATVRLLTVDGDGGSVDVEVPAASAVEVPAGFLEGSPEASALVTVPTGRVVALGASTSLGSHGESVFGMAMGVPVPVPAG